MRSTWDNSATVAELREWLATQPDDASVCLGGYGAALVGWTTGTRDNNPVVLLAFANDGGSFVTR